MNRRIAVTGVTGFIGAHVCQQLLSRGDRVIGAARDPGRIAATKIAALADGERFRLVQADLLFPDGFREAFAGCDAVLHVASPYRLEAGDPMRELVEPAVLGTRHVLQAAAATPTVKRVVLTSSMAAVTDEPDGRVLTEADWNTRSSVSRNPYYFAKTKAERTAWDFMQREGPGFELVVINPFLVVGPSLTPGLNTSNQIIVEAMTGVFPGVLDLTWGIVDVRDAAEAHVRALDAPAARGRYLCAAETVSMRRLVELLSPHARPGDRLPTRSLDSPLASRLAKLFAFTQPPGAATYMRTHLGRKVRFDASKIERDLGLRWRDIRSTIAETVADLREWGHLKT